MLPGSLPKADVGKSRSISKGQIAAATNKECIRCDYADEYTGVLS